ncbi:MAG TPA: sensor domain-containing diguanylate cyclase [Acidimicrobiales bacterium]|nr:sensor domain-containing diguanylate cyclase [Acidimicrobiales bacterium]
MDDAIAEPSDQESLVAEVLSHSSDLVVVADASLAVRFASRGVTEILGYEAEEVVGRYGLEFLHPDDAGLFAAVAAQSAVGYVPRGSIFYRLRHKNGSYVTLELSGGPAPDGTGGLAKGFWLLGRRPVRAEIYAEVLHRLLDEKPLAMALEGVGEAMLPDVGTRFCITLWLPDESLAAIGDRLPAQLSGRSTPVGSPWKAAIENGVAVTAQSLSELDEDTAEAARREGLSSVSVIPVAGLDGRIVATLTLWTPPGVPHATGSAQVLDRIKDLVATAIRLHQQIEGLKRSSESDPLTGLANRRVLNETFSAQVSDVESSVLCLDLDGFKEVNDTYGHATGDELLKIVAKRIQSVIRGNDLAVRLGGDEFAVISRGCGPDEARRLSERILETLRNPIVVQGSSISIRASIGVASARRIDEEILQRADNALYQAKREGSNTVRVV